MEWQGGLQNIDRQKANTKEEDPTGLLNEGFRYRDLETGTFISKDPAGFVDGPNLYSYVVDNPWTHFDPEGLWVKVKKHDRPNEDGTTTTVRTVTMTGKVQFKGMSAKMSTKEQERIVKRIEKGIKDRFSKTENKNEEVNVVLDFKIAKGAGDIKPDDHVFNIVDKAAYDKKTGKDDPSVGGESRRNGMVANLDKDYLNSNVFEKNAAHEFGHLIGLQHPNFNDKQFTKNEKLGKGVDIYNTNPVTSLEKSNVMRYSNDQSTVNSAQMDHSAKLSTDGRLNKGSNLDTLSADQ